MSRDFTEIDTDTPKGRLLAFCRMTGLSSNREIEKMLDLGNGYFRTADKGMNTGTICKVARKYPTLNLNWLICGCGNIYSQDNTQLEGERISAVAEPHPYYNAAGGPYQATVPVRMYENADVFCSSAEDPLPPRWLMIDKNLLRSRNDALVKITDDSLLPEYPAGEYMQVCPCPFSIAEHLPEGKKRLILLLLKDARPMVRMAGKYPGKEKMCLFSALNPDKKSFPDLVCTPQQISAFWDVANIFHV